MFWILDFEKTFSQVDFQNSHAIIRIESNIALI